MNSEIYSSIKLLTKSKIIKIETSITRGLPSIKIVGMIDKTIRESQDRVIAALKSSGFSSTPKKIRINLSPAELPKKGSHLDLPIALGIIKITHKEKANYNSPIIAFGELGLNGEVKKCSGLFNFLEAAEKLNSTKKKLIIIIPHSINNKILELYPKLKFIKLKNLSEIPSKINKPTPLRFSKQKTKKNRLNPFKNINGLENLKRTLILTVAGKHNLLIMGPTGTGKTLLLNTLPKLFPKPERDDIINISKIHDSKLTLNYPFQKIDKTTTVTQLIGSFNKQYKVGIATLADKGVLLIDDFTELKTDLYQNLNKLLDHKSFTIIIENEKIEIPSDFLLVATMHLCPCGKYGKKNRCTCSNAERKRYLTKIPQTTLNRIDLIAYTYESEFENLNRIYKQKINNNPITSPHSTIKQAWKKQKERYKNETYHYNSEIPFTHFEKYCKLNHETKKLFNISIEKFKLNTRSILKIIQLSRTIADISQNKNIEKKHLLEALSYKDYLLEN